jgi:nucleoside-diphosphate-sugar epimerase
MTDLHVVLGSTGGAGNAIARALLAEGHAVRGVNRSGSADLPDGIELLAADIATPAGAGDAVRGAAVVYMAAQPPYHRWPTDFMPMLETVVDAVATEGAKFVMVDNLYGYGPGAGVMTESTPERATDSKGATRRAMTEYLLEAHASGRLTVAIGRASDYFGPRGDHSSITAVAIEPIASGKGIKWLGRAVVPHSVAYLPDVARAYVSLGTSSAADGKVWILPHTATVTGQEFMDAVNAAVASPVKTGVLSKGMLRVAAPFHKMSREILRILYQFDEPFVVDDSAFRATFGPFADTPLEGAVEATVAFYVAAA